MNANHNHTNGTKTTDLTFDEAPASWNTRYIDPNGFECQLTLRCDSGKELLEKAASAVSYLLENGCKPFYTRNSYRPAETKADTQPTSDNGNNGGNGNYGNFLECFHFSDRQSLELLVPVYTAQHGRCW